MNYRSRPTWWEQVFLLLATLLTFLFTVPSLFGLVTFSVSETPLLALLSMVSPALFLFLLLSAAYKRYSWLYVVSEETIESHQGILSRHVASIRIRDLRNINVKQNVFQRMVGIGTIEFSSAGGAGVEVVFRGVADPMALRHKIQALQTRQDRSGSTSDGD